MWFSITLHNIIHVLFKFSGYNGKCEDGKTVLWDGTENVKFPNVYLVTTGTDFMKSFNMKTSEWLSLYIFRRLRSLNNIFMSQLTVFVFVALWHGLQFGYFAAFGLLSFSMLFDRLFFPYVRNAEVINFLYQKYRFFRLAVKAFGTMCRLFCLPFVPLGFQVVFAIICSN